MTNINEHYTDKMKPITDALEAMGCFRKVEVFALAGEIEFNHEGEGFQVEDLITITALHKSQDEYDCPVVEITICAGACIGGAPCSEYDDYLDEDGDFDEDKYMADVNDRLAELDSETECRENFIIRTVNTEDCIGEFSYSVSYPYIWGGDGDENVAELRTFLQSDTFATELADAVGEEEAA